MSIINTDIPVEISQALANTSPPQLQDNFRKFKRDTQRYVLDEWTTLEKINKTILHISSDTQRRQQWSSIPFIRLLKTLAFRPELQWKSLKNYNISLDQKLPKKKLEWSLKSVWNKANAWQSLDSQQQKHKKEKRKSMQIKPSTSLSASDIWSPLKMNQRQRMLKVTNSSTNSIKLLLNKTSPSQWKQRK
ncbi:hypothetical protein BDB01DRAFT_836292 [Pilobolus umbonatus]|nr:hypothetical protein BDB01DRAFT_836292 [Pilobolus umbonatus]